MFKSGVNKKIVICLMIAMFIFGSIQPAIKAAAGKKAKSREASYGLVLADINVRSDASTSSKIIEKLKTGENVTLVDRVTGSDGQEWYIVKTATGVNGYVYAAAIDEKFDESTNEETNSRVASSPSLNKIV